MKRKGIKAISRIISFMLVLTMVASLNGVSVLATGLGNSEDYSEETVAEENIIAEEEETEDLAEIIIPAEGENTEVVFEDDAVVDEDSDNQEDIDENIEDDENLCKKSSQIRITEVKWGDGSDNAKNPNNAYFWSDGDGIVYVDLMYIESSTALGVFYNRKINVQGKGWTELNFKNDCGEFLFGNHPGEYYYTVHSDERIMSSDYQVSTTHKQIDNFNCLATPTNVKIEPILVDDGQRTTVKVTCDPVENADKYIFMLEGEYLTSQKVVATENTYTFEADFLSRRTLYKFSVAAGDSTGTYFSSDIVTVENYYVFHENIKDIHIGNMKNGEDPRNLYFTLPNSYIYNAGKKSSFKYWIDLYEEQTDSTFLKVDSISEILSAQENQITFGVDISEMKHSSEKNYYVILSIAQYFNASSFFSYTQDTASPVFEFIGNEALNLNVCKAKDKYYLRVYHKGNFPVGYCYQVKNGEDWENVDAEYLKTSDSESELLFHDDLIGKEFRVMAYYNGPSKNGVYCGACYSNVVRMEEANPFNVEGVELELEMSSDGQAFEITTSTITLQSQCVDVEWDNVTVEWYVYGEPQPIKTENYMSSFLQISSSAVEKYIGKSLYCGLKTTVNSKTYSLWSNQVTIPKKNWSFTFLNDVEAIINNNTNSFIRMDLSNENEVELTGLTALKDYKFDLVISDIEGNVVYEINHKPGEAVPGDYTPLRAEDGSFIMKADTEYTLTLTIPSTAKYNYFFTEFKMHTMQHKCDKDYCEENADFLEHWKVCTNRVFDKDQNQVTCNERFAIESHKDANDDGLCDICNHAIHKADLLYIENLSECTYNGSAQKPEFEVWLGNKILENGKDYKVTYKNNKNACDKDSVNSKGKKNGPSITVTGKGNYSGTVTEYFTIEGKVLPANCVEDIYVNETKKNIKVNPSVTVDGKKLKLGKDFEILDSLNNKVSSYKEKGEYNLKVKAIGNYAGESSFKFVITGNQLTSKLKVDSIPNQKYTGERIEPAITVNKKPIDTNLFNLVYRNNRDTGVAQVLIMPKPDSGYEGNKIVKFKIVGTKISSAKLTEKLSDGFYTGENYDPELKLAVSGTALIKGTDYTVEYFKDVNVGEAYALVTGRGKCEGTAKFKYKILPFDATEDKTSITVDCVDTVKFVKGGAKPVPTVKFNGNTLTENVDYKLSYSNNTKIGLKDATNKKGKIVAPTVKVAFKGNFKGTKTRYFTIEKQSITAVDTYAADKAYQNKKDAWKQKTVVLTDLDGKKLAAGKDYKITGYYKDWDCTEKITEKVLEKGTTVYVLIEGLNNYDGTCTAFYTIRANNISSAKVKVQTSFKYTGEAVSLSYDDIVVTDKSGNKLVGGVDFEIVESTYTNNVNKGTASVKIRGVGNYAGDKVVKYNIGVIKFLWWKLF